MQYIGRFMDLMERVTRFTRCIICTIEKNRKVWNIDINLVVIKKQKNIYKDICLVKFEVLGYQNTKK